MTRMDAVRRRLIPLLVLLAGAFLPFAVPVLAAQQEHRPGGEVNLLLPDLNQGDFLGHTGHQILLSGLVVCVLGLLFGLWSYRAVQKLPVHRSMAEVSELIYVTCKAYLVQQGKFLLLLLAFIGGRDRRLLHAHGARTIQDRDRAALQPDRHGGQLRRGVVRHPHQHLRQLAHGVLQPRGQGRSRCTRSRCGPA